MRRFLTILIVGILLVSMVGITTVFAGASISGYSTVSAGRSYTYKGTASYSAGDIICKIEGLGKVSSGFAGASGEGNQSLTATASIKVTIPSTANPGDTFSIKFSGSYSVMKADGSGVESEHNFSTTKTITVGTPSTPNPNATPRPLEGWEVVEEAVDDAEDGAVVEAVMEGDYKIPEALLKKLVEKKNILVIDFGTYKCTIDPAKLTEFEEIGTLDLSLIFQKVGGISEIAEELDLYQLHFGHSGELPGMLKFTFEATENVPGDMVYLYYYYGEANVAEGKATAIVDENGMVTFEIYHCSSYFVTGEILPVAMSNFDTESADALEEMVLTLEESNTTLSDTQTAFENSQTQVTGLEEELVGAREETASLQNDLEEAEGKLEDEKEAAAAHDPSSVSLIVFIAALVAVLLLSILLTMMFCRAGLFKRSEETESAAQEQANAVNEKYATMSRQQAKLDARGAKAREKQNAIDARAQEKQDAIDAKHRAKLDAMEAKQQAKDAKKEAKKLAKQDGDDETQI